MSGKRSPLNAKTHRRRLARASAIVAALVLAAPVGAWASSGETAAMGSLDGARSGIRGLSSAAFKEEADPFGALDKLDDLANVHGSIPDAFLDEAGFPAGSSEERVAADGAVLGCVVQLDEAKAFDSVQTQLQEKGWSAVPLGGVCGATFVKETGRLQWMVVTCTQVGDAASIVYRLELGS